jgi:Sugar-transfer associated ATP-grasp
VPILATRLPDWNFDFGKALSAASQARGISVPRLGLEIYKLWRGRQKLTWQEYFLFGAHRPWHNAESRAEFVGDTIQTALNEALTPAGQSLQGLISDKLLTDMVLTRAGLPAAPIRAVAVAVEADAPYPLLRDVRELDDFLSTTSLPVFGKPVHGSRGLAAISIVDRQGGNMILGDGQSVNRAELAAEILSTFPHGYVFQELSLPHPELARIVGPVIGTVRVVTVRVGRDIVPLYAALKMPGAGQMVDDLSTLTSTLCAVDHQTGRIIRGQDRRKLGGVDLLTNPVTGVDLPGAQIPLWPEVMALARDSHRVLYRQGIVGGDFAITPTGPLVIELNANPRHAMYQKSHARGFWNADIAPVMTEALAGFGHRKRTRDLPYP